MSRATQTDDIGIVEEGPLAAILAALARDDPNGVVAALDGELQQGRPGSPAAIRHQVGQRLATALAEQSGRVSHWIDALATSPSPTARQVACLLLASRYPEDPAGVLRTAEMLAEDRTGRYERRPAGCSARSSMATSAGSVGTWRSFDPRAQRISATPWCWR